MPYYTTSQEWLEQSQLLLKARPTTTRITTKYTLSKPVPAPEPAATTESTRPAPPRAELTLKTYDPKTGATLKYKTTKAAEVGRLIAALGRMGRTMSGLPPVKEDVTMVEAVTDTVAGAVETVVEEVKAAVPAAKPSAKKGKKKGKK